MCLTKKLHIVIDGRLVDNEVVRSECMDEQRPTIVLLHQGLGELSQWKDLPRLLCERLKVDVFSYSRFGHGKSAPFRNDEEPSYLEVEAVQYLPQILAQAKITNPFLVGHSDGATIALLFGASFPSNLTAAVVVSPHVFVEELTCNGIKEALVSYKAKGGFYQALNRKHEDADKLVSRWSKTWLAPEFSSWSIEEQLIKWKKPLMVVQGDKDEYGSLAQVNAITQRAKAATKILAGCGHLPFTERAKQMFTLLVDFYGAVVELNT